MSKHWVLVLLGLLASIGCDSILSPEKDHLPDGTYEVNWSNPLVDTLRTPIWVWGYGPEVVFIKEGNGIKVTSSTRHYVLDAVTNEATMTGPNLIPLTAARSVTQEGDHYAVEFEVFLPNYSGLRYYRMNINREKCWEVRAFDYLYNPTTGYLYRDCSVIKR